MAGEKDNGNSLSNKTNNETFDHGSPYYLHPSDYLRVVDETLQKPEKTHVNHMDWLRCDAMIKGQLTIDMEREIISSVKYASTTEEIWNNLRDRFGKESAPRAYELKQLLTKTKQDGASVSAYYTKLRALWDEISSVFNIPKCSCAGCKCGISKRLTELRDKERLYKFVLGLDNEFSTIRTKILAMKPIPTLGEAYHLVAEDEQQRAVSTGKRTNSETVVFQAHIKRDANVWSQRKMGPRNGKRGGNDKVEHCDFCGKYGHTRDGCFKRIGYPEWWPDKRKPEKGIAKAAFVETEWDSMNDKHGDEKITISGLSSEQYRQFVNLFTTKNSQNTDVTQPIANMAGKFDEGND
ncbi:uncharacterized protein LOC111882319 [Lactuca sativa]|uniref:uncharacterized protein LOC111882319 n=1 Tax=Lactuca sativa TaxID=4236 RepID=UPI000CD907F2|nr:uncharacterized protein LOC111882319 [Lactuca sativa]